LGYALSARRGWPVGLIVGSAAYACAAALLQALPLPHWGLFMVALASLWLAAKLIPHEDLVHSPIPAPWWDLPARLLVATALVVGITAIAAFVGAQTAGALASFPIFGATLTIFAHRMKGPATATQVLRGLVLALYGFAVCFFILGLLLEKVGIITA